MFLDEARLAASLNHQNVAQVFEVGEDAGIHYLAMEYVHGQDLRALLAKAGSQGTRVPLELALTVIAGAASGLNHAHERRDSNGVPLGIVHRDVSPSNIMIGLDGSVKLLDFGIAKATARSVETVAGIIKGKFAYMAPEQCRGRDVDKRSDVFSLGIILYEITTQHRCFRADSDFDTMHRIVTGDVVRPTRLVQGYPQALEAIVMKALAVDANQRYQSAHMLLEAIESFSVAARMSLSTMSLGRFMRDMFGETPEPWLQPGRASQQMPLQPTESTISNTNGSSEAPRRSTTTSRNDDDEPPVHLQAAHTLLDLPRGHGDEPDPYHEFDEPNAAEWNAKSYPTMQPSYASAATLPPEGLKSGRTSSPHLPVVITQPSVTAQAPPMTAGSQPSIQAPTFLTPGSGSGPAHPAIPSTRHGYANAPGVSRNDVSYPRYEAASESMDDLRLKPNRRPLFIGFAIVVVGVAIVLAIMIGGSKNNVVPIAGSDDKALDPTHASEPVIAPKAEPEANTGHVIEGSAEPKPANGVPEGSGEPSAQQVEESISIKVISVPDGADVLLAGRPIGTTPLETKVKRGTGSTTLVVHHAGYQDVPTRIDLTSDFFSKEVTLVKLPEKKPPTVEKKPPTVEKKPPTVEKKPPVTVEKKPPVVKKDPPVTPTIKKDPPVTPTVKKDPPVTGPGSGSAAPTPSIIPKKPPCQPPNQIDPFDSRPVCK
jgi:serine/threonine-protein kinase